MPVHRLLRWGLLDLGRIDPADRRDVWWADLGGTRLMLHADHHSLCGRRSPIPRWYVCCPACGRRYLALYELGGRLACRRCLGLRYQSQTKGRWDVPLLLRVEARTAALAHRPGPKGRRARVWRRRLDRIEGTAWRWLQWFDEKYGDVLGDVPARTAGGGRRRRIASPPPRRLTSDRSGARPAAP